MHGQNVGTLQVLRQTGVKEEPAVMWQYSNEQGESWREANVDILLYGDQIRVNYSLFFIFYFW